MKNLTREDLINEAQTKSKSIALIYSPIELHEYIVEIISKDSNQFIRQSKDISHFHSLDEAISKATKYGALEYFLCADNTYDECDSLGSAQKFDYIPISAK